MILTISRIEELKQITNKALEKLYEDDPELIQKTGMERSAAFRFGLYFYCLIRKIDWLASLDIDMEYNKRENESKDIPSRGYWIQPDFLLHRRDEDSSNILVIELKHWSNNQDRNSDKTKIADLVDQEGKYKYGLGIFIELKKDSFDCELILGYKPQN